MMVGQLALRLQEQHPERELLIEREQSVWLSQVADI
jgi:hypothetical protein